MKNSELKFYTLVHIEVYVEPSGLTKSAYRVESFNVHPVWLNMEHDGKTPGTVLTMIFDLLFLVMFVYVAVMEILEMVRLLRRKGCKEGMSEYWSVWNVIDWMNICNVLIIVILYFYCNTLVSGTNQIVDEFPTFAESTRYNITDFAAAVRGPNSLETCTFQPENCIDAYTTRLSHLLHQSERTLWAYWELKYFIALFAFTSALKFFKAFRANPKLNVVTETLIGSSSDLAHFMIVFCALLMAFVLVAYLLFGGRLYEFSSANQALNTCFLFLLCFAFDGLSADMFEHGGHLGLIWSWLFNLVMMVLLLNMILAIIFDVYTEVKTAAGDAPSLIQQSKDMYQSNKELKQKQKEFNDDVKRKTRKSLKQHYVGDGTGKVLDDGPVYFNGKWRDLNEGKIVGEIDMAKSELTWPGGSVCKFEASGDECYFRHFTGQKVLGKLAGDRITWDDGDVWIRDGTDGLTGEEGEEPAEEITREVRASQNLDTLVTAAKQATAHNSPKTRNTIKSGLIKETVMWTEDRLLSALNNYDAHEEDIVHPGSLAEALDATQLQAEQLQDILHKAREHSAAEAEVEEVSLTDSIRLVGRIDTNSRSILRSEMNKIKAREKKPLDMLNERMVNVETALGGLAHRIDTLLGR